MFSIVPHAREISRLTPGQKSLQTKKNLPDPRFGCRLAGIMTQHDNRQTDSFTRSMMSNLPEIANGKKPFATKTVYPMASLLQSNQSDGWGYACFLKDDQDGFKLEHIKRHENILQDEAFARLNRSLSEKLLGSGIWHVRKSTDVQGPRDENAHPFHLKMDGADWTFAHNGMWPQALQPRVKEALAKDPRFSPQGTTDSEHAFRFLMRSVHKRLGTLDSEKSGEENIIRAVAEGIRKLTREPGKAASKDIPESGLGVKGRIRMGPSHNFLLSDKRMMIAYRKGQSLYLGIQQDKDGKPIAHAVATVPFQTKGVTWTDILDDHMVVIRRDPKSGATQTTILPLDEIPPLEKKPPVSEPGTLPKAGKSDSNSIFFIDG